MVCSEHSSLAWPLVFVYTVSCSSARRLGNEDGQFGRVNSEMGRGGRVHGGVVPSPSFGEKVLLSRMTYSRVAVTLCDIAVVASCKFENATLCLLLEGALKHVLRDLRLCIIFLRMRKFHGKTLFFLLLTLFN